jgi:hypothetical protein
VRSKKPENPWGELVCQRLQTLKKSEKDFCKEAGLLQSTFAEMKQRRPSKGKVPPSVKLEQWTRALELKGPAAEDLMVQTLLLYAPESVQQLVSKLQRELDACRRQHALGTRRR